LLWRWKREREINFIESWLQTISCHVLSLNIRNNFDWFVRFVQTNPLIAFPKVTKLEIALTNFDTDDNLSLSLSFNVIAMEFELWNLFSHVYAFPQACAFT
jgi:hypothetical protein